MTFRELQEVLTKEDGTKLSRQGVCKAHDLLMMKLRRLLIEDPIIREYLIEHRLITETELDDAHFFRHRNDGD